MRVVMTGARGTLAGLETALAPAGMTLIGHPLLDFAPPEDWAPLDQALARLGTYGALAVTSPRAAHAVAGRLAARARTGSPLLPPPQQIPVWTAGRASARPLEPWFATLHPVHPAPDGAAAAVARAMLEGGVASPILFPCGDLRRDTLIAVLQAAGRQVDAVVVYRSVLASPEAARAACAAGDVLLVASPSVARLLASACDPSARPILVAIGPTTGAACIAAGWPPAATAQHPTVEAVVAALRQARALAG